MKQLQYVDDNRIVHLTARCDIIQPKLIKCKITKQQQKQSKNNHDYLRLKNSLIYTSANIKHRFHRWSILFNCYNVGLYYIVLVLLYLISLKLNYRKQREREVGADTIVV